MGDLNQLHDAILTGDANLARDLIAQALQSGLNLPRQQRGASPVLLGNLNPVTVLRKGNPGTVTAAIVEWQRQAGPRATLWARAVKFRATRRRKTCGRCANLPKVANHENRGLTNP